jgi:hypothetical protein
MRRPREVGPPGAATQRPGPAVQCDGFNNCGGSPRMAGRLGERVHFTTRGLRDPCVGEMAEPIRNPLFEAPGGNPISVRDPDGLRTGRTPLSP